MTSASAHPKFRRRFRLVCLSCVLALSAVAMWVIVWKRVEQTRIVTWVAALGKLGIDADVEVDPWDSSLYGRFRTWIKVPITQVYVWGEPEAKLLLSAPTGDPRPLLLHINGRISDQARQRLAERFPGAELRTVSNQGFF
jgi:hypothetical protein